MPLPYGAQPHGLLCGYRFHSDRAGEATDLTGATDFLHGDEAGFVWLHFDLKDASAERWIADHLPCPPEFFEALRQGSRSSRIDLAGDAMIAVLNDIAYDFSPDTSETSTLWISAGPRLAVTARVHPLRSVDLLHESVKKGQGFGTALDLLNHLLERQGGVLEEVVRATTLKVDSLEDSLLRGRITHQRAELGKLRRVLVRLSRLLAPEPGAMFRLLRQPPTWLEPQSLDDLRQATEGFSLIIRDLGALQERIKLLQEEIAAQVNEQTGKTLFMLTMVTVLALPINITSGFFGMNVGGTPLAEHPYGFWLIVLLIAGFTLAVGWWAFKRVR